MPRQPQSNRAIQVVGDAAPRGLLDRLPIAACGDRPATSAFDDRDARLDVPPLAVDIAGKGPLALAAGGTPCQGTGWPPRDWGNAALEAQIVSPPAGVGLGIVAAIGPQRRTAPSGQGLCHQGATRHMVPSRPTVGHRPTPHHGGGPDGYRPLPPRAGAVALPGPRLVGGAGLLAGKARGLHGHRARARGGHALEHAGGLGQDPGPQARVARGAADPPPPRMLRPRVPSKRLPECWRAGPQGCRTPGVHRQRCRQAQTGQSRGWRLPRWGKWAGRVGPLGACHLESHACQAEDILTCHGASPPSPCIEAGEQRVSTEQVNLSN
jgi:hypothetical protein